MERRSEDFHPKEPDNQGITAAFGQGTFHIRELSIRTENRGKPERYSERARMFCGYDMSRWQ